ncbi:hypothetical protein JDV02_007598 [Purpureocillium takamizusanense]|uniref:DAGKc domain-containing protein n=1 Tax=Purpureocillium takamizusanense TaxID=2060973 RepID=A0A9Q8QNE3_9HYPO|nr:uncharacterized protein JDV02_007598 [Purpureocillium takamizusanense]UNI21622.1 hypothetical protein JDV02_007598 [Purpureocillium takamizusanense]
MTSQTNDILRRQKPTATAVQDVRVQDDNLVWTDPSDGAQQHQVRLDQVLFTLPAAPEGSIIVCLVEDDDTAAAAAEHKKTQPPFRLVALRADGDGSPLTEQLLLRDGRERVDELPAHLRRRRDDDGKDANDVRVVVSTGSGVGHAVAFWEQVLRPLFTLVGEALGQREEAAVGADPKDVVVTEDAHSVRRFARALSERRSKGERQGRGEEGSSTTVILLSGDGGVADLLNGIGGSSSSSDGSTAVPVPPPAPLVALLPLGTANALFHSLHKPVSTGPSPLVLALRTLFLGAPADLPAFRASFSPGARIVSYATSPTPPSAEAGGKDSNNDAVESLYGAIVASYGFHASLVHESDTPAYRVHGSKRFGMVAQDLLRESHPYRARLFIRRPSASASASSTSASAPNGAPPPPPAPAYASASSPPQQPLEPFPPGSSDGGNGGNTHAYVLATMVSNLERTFTISPASTPLDNRLRLVHFGPIGGPRTMEVMMAAYDGGAHVGMAWDDDDDDGGHHHHRVAYEEVDELRVEVREDDDARWRVFCVDGTIVEVPRRGHMAVEKAKPGLLRVLVDPRVQGRR